MDNKTETMTEQELERAADELLAADEIKDAPCASRGKARRGAGRS